jgi:nucleotide-binding universal stress UspA family protein
LVIEGRIDRKKHRRLIKMFRRILVPVDGSEYASHAVEVAIDLAKRYQASVFLLHVIRDFALPKEIIGMIKAGEITESRRELLENSAEIILSSASEQCDGAGLLDVTSEYITGDPASRIVEYAEQKGVDLIVIGHHGLGPHDGLLGGVARKLTNISTTSCLVVR